MHYLKSGSLSAAIINPETDTELLGNRYCWGGYIWHVNCAERGDLTTGPEWPVSPPDPWNGQGLPEVFRWDDKILGHPTTVNEQEGFIIGIGQAHMEGKQPVVDKPSTWDTDLTADSCTMTSEDGLGSQRYRLKRRITLTDGKELSATTHITNIGEAPLPVHWYAHPFLPHDAQGHSSISLQTPVTIADNPGYLLDSGELSMRGDTTFDAKGHFLWLGMDPGATLTGTHNPQTAKAVTIRCDGKLTMMPVWANNSTFSIEPYHLRHLLPGAEAQWSISYTWA